MAESLQEQNERLSKQMCEWKEAYHVKEEQNAKMKAALEFALKYNAMRAEQGKREFPSQLVSAINKALGK